MSDEDGSGGTGDLVARVAAGLAGAAVGLTGPVGELAGAALTPVLERALAYLNNRFFRQRVMNAAETLAEAAVEAGATSEDEFEEFVEKLFSDEQHQELLARVLSIAQDSAMRDKRRALGRVLANAAYETGTKVDNEFATVRVIADLDPVHVRLLRIMSLTPVHLAQYATDHGLNPESVRSWYPWSVEVADPGLAEAVWGALPVLERHGLISKVGEFHTPNGGWEPEYRITEHGDYFVELLAATEVVDPEGEG